MQALQDAYRVAEAEWRDLTEGTRPVFYVGMATCGKAAGAGRVIDQLKLKLDELKLDAEIVSSGCLGPCSLEPLVIVQKPGRPAICYGNIGPKEINEIVDRHIVNDKPCPEFALGALNDESWGEIGPLVKHPMLDGQQRNVLRNCGIIDPEKIHHYLARDGFRGFLKALELGPEGVIEQVKKSDLRGRGGAGFPAFLKWHFCRSSPGDPKYLICNADEGDPGAFMNRSLLEGDPLAVLEGMLIAGLAIGASQGYIYCRAEYPLAIERLELAIAEMRKLGLFGERILGSEFCFDVEIKIGAGAFVCGEETALIASIEGRRGMPLPRPPFPANKGLNGKPTVIQNVESLANLPLILRRGHAWYRTWGTKSSKGTKTFALAGKIERKGLIEVPLGTTLRKIVYDIGGGIPEGKAFKAVQTGGPSGGCLPAEKLDLPVDYESLAAAGSIMGSGGMVVIDEDVCAVGLAKFFLSFTKDESCGKCPPCRIGTAVMYNTLERITEGKGTMEDLDQLESMAETITAGALCGLGKTAPNPVLTTLKYFHEEYKAHVLEGCCSAFECKALIAYHIDAERCTACGSCQKVCPTGAIVGEKKKDPFFIREELCHHCGACLPRCPDTAAAIFRTSGKLTRVETRKAAR